MSSNVALLYKQARRGRMRQPATADSGATIWQRTFHELKFLVYRQTDRQTNPQSRLWRQLRCLKIQTEAMQQTNNKKIICIPNEILCFQKRL